MPSFLQTIKDWSGGVITSGANDRPLPTASPRGRNSYLTSIGPSTAYPATRRGLKTVNAGNGVINGSGQAVQNQINYVFNYLGAPTRMHLVETYPGILSHIISDPGGSGNVTNITTTEIVQSAVPMDFATMSNLCFMVNGYDRLKMYGYVLQHFGIFPPTQDIIMTPTGVGNVTGTYDVRMTFYNSQTGAESSTRLNWVGNQQTFAGQQITFSTVQVSSDVQVLERRIYIRNVNTMANYYLAVTIPNNTATTAVWNGFDYNLLLKGPDFFENDPPPLGVRYLAAHRSRMFAATENAVYYSKLGKPEAFDIENYELVNPDDGQKITAIRSFGDCLLVFKTKSIFGLFGVDPESWSMRLISADTGCSSFRSVVQFNGTDIAWWSEQGPMRMDGDLVPSNLGRLLPTTIDPAVLNYAQFPNVVAAVDPVREHLIFAVAEDEGDGLTRNNRWFPYNYRLGCWVSDGWDPIQASSLATIEDNTGQKWVYAGNYNGQLFRLWDTDNDGVPGGTITGSYTAVAGLITDIPGTGFYTVGTGLKGRYVRFIDSQGALVARGRITSNTATALTCLHGVNGINAGTAGLVVGQRYTFYIGGPAFEWDTGWDDNETPFLKKRYEFAYVQFDGAISSTATIAFYNNYEPTPALRHQYTRLTIGPPPVQQVSIARVRAARTGFAWQIRIANFTPDTPLAFYSVGIRGETVGDKVSV